MWQWVSSDGLTGGSSLGKWVAAVVTGPGPTHGTWVSRPAPRKGAGLAKKKPQMCSVAQVAQAATAAGLVRCRGAFALRPPPRPRQACDPRPKAKRRSKVVLRGRAWVRLAFQLTLLCLNLSLMSPSFLYRRSSRCRCLARRLCPILLPPTPVKIKIVRFLTFFSSPFILHRLIITGARVHKYKTEAPSPITGSVEVLCAVYGAEFYYSSRAKLLIFGFLGFIRLVL